LKQIAESDADHDPAMFEMLQRFQSTRSVKGAISTAGLPNTVVRGLTRRNTTLPAPTWPSATRARGNTVA